MKLERRYVEKPWGRTSLPPMFTPPPGKRIGEVWFTGAGDQPLLAKYIFTSERLSIQVHPDDGEARARGLAGGKSECWYIVDAAPESVIGLGFRREVSKQELRSAALDGSIERLIDWRTVRAGDFLFVRPGTVHAIGGGISLLEFQQNSDVTYRLYDYGRPRELHLADGIAVAHRGPFGGTIEHLSAVEQQLLVDGPAFSLAKSTTDAFTDRPRWVMPLEGLVRSGGDEAGAGECLLVPPFQPVESNGAQLLIGAIPSTA
jgi:mannose-6-phosphate isomerase